MPLFSFNVDIRGMRRKFSALVSATTPNALAEPLLRTGGFVRARIKRDTFDTEGAGTWKHLDPETQKRKLTESHVALLQDTGRGKLNARSPVRRIVREADAAEKAAARALVIRQKLDAAREKGRKTETLHRRLAGALGRQAKAIRYIREWRFHAIASGVGQGANLVAYARAEVARAKRHGLVLKAYKAALRQGHGFSAEERRALLRKSARRYRADERSTKVLGGLRDSIALHLAPNRIEIFSKAHIGAIHNFGGTAGHGAKIPARPFMALADEDMQFLIRLLREQMIAAWLDTPTQSAEQVA